MLLCKSIYLSLLGNNCCVRLKPVSYCTCAFVLALAFIRSLVIIGRRPATISNHVDGSSNIVYSLAKSMLFWNQRLNSFIPVNFSARP